MLDICVDELNCTGLSFNVKKSCLLGLRFEPRYMRVCEPITLYDNMCIRQDILELNCVEVNVLVWICVQQNPIYILVLTAYFTVLLVIRMNLLSYLLYGSECN